FPVAKNSSCVHLFPRRNESVHMAHRGSVWAYPSQFSCSLLNEVIDSSPLSGIYCRATAANTSKVCSAHRRHANCAARSRPFADSSRRSSEFSSTASMQMDISSSEDGSKYLNTPPEISGKHEPLAAMVGTPQAMDSIMGRQNPSYNEGNT